MSVDLRGFDSRARSIIETAHQFGWTGRVTTKGHYLMRAPDGLAITVPSKLDGRPRSEKNTIAPFRKWLREHSPHATAIMDSVADVIVDAGPEEFVTDSIVDAIVVAKAARVSHAAMDYDARTYRATLPTPTEEPAMPTPPVSTDPARRTFTVSPWLAKKSPNRFGGTLYPSPTTLQRTWSDGDVDYACALDGCGYTSDKPVSVARHYGAAHTRSGETAPAHTDEVVPGVDYTEPQNTRDGDYVPSDRLVEALAEWLRRTNLNVSPPELAALFLTWAHERPDLADVEHRQPEPMTDADILGRIRALVWSEAANERDALADRLATAAAERDAAVARLESVERDLQALSDIVDGIRRPTT